MISSATQVGKGIKSGLETRGGNNQLEDARESLHRHGNAFANVTSTEAEVRGGEMQRVFFEAAGCAGHRRLAAGRWCGSPLEEGCSALPQGRKELQEAAHTPAAMPQCQDTSDWLPQLGWRLAFGAQGDSSMLFNADRADG